MPVIPPIEDLNNQINSINRQLAGFEERHGTDRPITPDEQGLINKRDQLNQKLKEAQNASGLPSNEEKVPGTGPVAQGGGEEGGTDTQLKPPGQPGGTGGTPQEAGPQGSGVALTAESVLKQKPGSTSHGDIGKMSDEEFNKLVSAMDETGAYRFRVSDDSVRWGMTQGEDVIPQLEKMRNDATKAGLDAVKSGDNAKFQANMGKAQWFNNAIEGVRKKGTNYDRVLAENKAKPTTPEPPPEEDENSDANIESRSGQPPTETPTPAAEAAKPAEQTDESGAMFRIKKTNSGRDTREWTKTKFGRRVGDAHDEGMPEQVVAVNNKHTPGMPDEYVVNEISEILGPNAVELKSRDMTPEEIKAKQEKLRKDNEKLKEMGFPEEPIPELPAKPTETTEARNARWKAEEDAVVKQNMDKIPENSTGVVLKNKEGQRATITRNTGDNSKWRLTWFKENGEPAGHFTFDTREDALRSGLGIKGNYKGPPHLHPGYEVVEARGPKAEPTPTPTTPNPAVDDLIKQRDEAVAKADTPQAKLDAAKPFNEKIADLKQQQESDQADKIVREKQQKNFQTYSTATGKTKIGAGVPTEMEVTGRNKIKTKVKGTKYGDWFIYSRKNPAGSTEPETFKVIHAPSGMDMMKLGFLNMDQARQFVKALTHSKLRTDWSTRAELSPKEKRLLTQVTDSWRTGKSVPDYFKPGNQEPEAETPQKPAGPVPPAAAAAQAQAHVSEVASDEGKSAAVQIKNKLVARVEEEINKAIKEAGTILDNKGQTMRNGKVVTDYIAHDGQGGLAFGEVTQTPEGKFSARAWRHSETGFTRIFNTLEEAEWFIKGMSVDVPGNSEISIPKDGDFKLARSGGKLMQMWKEAKALDTSSGHGPKAPGASNAAPTIDEVLSDARKLYGDDRTAIAKLEDQLKRDAQNPPDQQIPNDQRVRVERAIQIMRDGLPEVKLEGVIKEHQDTLKEAQDRAASWQKKIDDLNEMAKNSKPKAPQRRQMEMAKRQLAEAQKEVEKAQAKVDQFQRQRNELMARLKIPEKPANSDVEIKLTGTRTGMTRMTNKQILAKYGDFFRSHPINSEVTFRDEQGNTAIGTVRGHQRTGSLDVMITKTGDNIPVSESDIITTTDPGHQPEVSPITTPEQAFRSAKTGQPFRTKLLRGQGTDKSPYSQYVPQEPILGKGFWTTPSREYASIFGKNITEHDVFIENPLVIRTDEEWRDLIKQAGWKYANPFGQDLEITKKNIRDIRALIESKGHDGVVIDPSEDGDAAKTLWNVFGEQQAVDFKSQGKGTDPGHQPEIPPTEPGEPDRGGRVSMNPIPEPVERALDNFFEQDVKPFVKGVGNLAKAGIDLVGKIFSPASFASVKDVDILFRSKGAKERFLTRAAAAMDGVHAQFGKMSEADQIAFVDRVKKGLKQPTPELQQAADLMRHWDDRLYRAAARFKPDLNYLENHMRVLWEVIPGSPEALQRQGITAEQIASKRPWRGSQGFLKGHTLSSMSEGIEKGGVPVTYNPVEMFMLHAQDVMKYVAANQAWEQGKDSGSVQFVKRGESPPLNFIRINDSIGKAYFRTKEGLLSNTGEWWVEQGMGRMINNYLSRDYLRQGSAGHPELGKIGRGLLALKNGTTAIELGMSPFHAVFETNEAMGSSMGLGIRKLLAGQFKAGAQELGRAAFVEPLQVAQPAVKILSLGKINLKAPPGSTTKIGEAGIKFAKNEEQFRANEPEAYDWFTKNFPNAKDLITDLFDGGGQVNMNEDYRIKGLRGFQKARAADNPIGAALRAIPTINEQALKPLFEQYIPRLKVGMFLKEHSFELAHDPDYLSGKITRGELARKNWALIEDRFGELNWDNLYWDRNLKTGLQLAFRSVTWKLGNMRAFGKAFRDVGTELYRSGSEGKMIRMTPAIGWLLGMSVVTAIQASLITKLTTGKWPADLARNTEEFRRNLIFPRIDEHDASQRVSIPTYWKDLVHFRHDPVDYVHSSMTGEIGRLWDTWNNRDFYGVQVYSADDPKAQAGPTT